MIKKILLFAFVGAVAISSAQNGQRGQGRQGGRQNNSITGLLQRTDVIGELKITDDQKTKLEALRPARGQRGAGGGGGNGGGGNGGGGGGQRGNFDPEAMAKAQAEREKATFEVLTADQVKRLHELFIQKVGARAITRTDVQDALKLTATQKEKVASLQTSQREANQSVMEKVRAGEIERTAVADIQKKNDAALLEELNKVLTAEQKDKLKEMGGTPFKFDEDPSNG